MNDEKYQEDLLRALKLFDNDGNKEYAVAIIVKKNGKVEFVGNSEDGGPQVVVINEQQKTVTFF